MASLLQQQSRRRRRWRPRPVVVMAPSALLTRHLSLLTVTLVLLLAARRPVVAAHRPSATATATAALVVAASMTDHVAREARSSAAASASSTAPTTTSTANTSEQERIRASLLEWYTSNFKENEVVLLGLPSNLTTGLADSDKPCPQLPSVQMRSSTLQATGCPRDYANLSCACLTGYIRAGVNEFWEFKVRRKSPTPMALPIVANSTSVLEIDSISTLWAPPTLRGLRINGWSAEPLPISFITDNRDASTDEQPIARSEAKSFNLETVEIYNVNMDKIVSSSGGFIPRTVKNLTMRNCGLKTYGFRFGLGLTSVQYLDFSVNKLTFPLAGSNTTGDCAICLVRTLNLTSNLITIIPPYLFTLKDLERLYLAQNDLDYNVSTAVFEGIRKLVEFTADGPKPSAPCMAGGKLRTAHNVTFCVADDDTLSIGTGKQNDTSALIYVVIGCAVVVVALALLLFVQRRRRSRRSSSKDERESMFVNTLDFEDSHSTTQARLLNDPLLITNRIPYGDVRVGKCISQGGFGLVFVGTYLGRKVAIKKIRPDLSDDISHIDFFLKEIGLMAMLVHPRIVEFVGVAWDSLRHLSAVTEFMERGDLRDVLQGFKSRGCRLTWASHKTHISVHIAEALTYLHSLRPKKVIHRDLKSKNVLLNADLEAKLSDFGISRERRFEETHMTAGIGTSFWIAPEVLLGKDYDERADIFSFGVVLCEIDTDDYPYWNDKNPQHGGKLQQAEILRQVADGSLRPTFSDDCPKAILDLADSCLQADPADRPTAPEIVYELQRMLRDSWSS